MLSKMIAVLWAIIDFIEKYNGTVTAVATVFMGVFTWVLAYTTGRQARLTKATLELARDEFLSTHRPHVRIKAVFLMSERFFHNEPIVIRVVCVNRGVTDATIKSYGIECLVLRKGTPIPPDKKIAVIPLAEQSVLQSGISVPLPDFSHSLAYDQEVAIMDGQASLYCIGFVHYWDGAKRTRLTAFCRILTFDPVSPVPIGRFSPTNEPHYEYED